MSSVVGILAVLVVLFAVATDVFQHLKQHVRPAVRITLRPPTRSHAPSSHAPSSHRHPPTRLPSIGSTSTSHFLFRNLYPLYVWDAASSHLHPIITLFFYRSFRKVYAMSNRMYLSLPIDRFLRTRSRNLLMYLDPLVSLRFSSFELALHIYHILFRSCRTNLVSRSQVTLLTPAGEYSSVKSQDLDVVEMTAFL